MGGGDGGRAGPGRLGRGHVEIRRLVDGIGGHLAQEEDYFSLRD
ncbi:hypothetical protein [Micromonospora rubida]|nr:hypothetical protein [Micromonospora rubida]